MPSVSGNAAQFEQEGDSLDKVLGDLEKGKETKEEPAPAEKTAEESPAETKQEAETQPSSGETIKEDAKNELSEKEKEDRAFNKRWKERLQKRDEEWEERLKEQEKSFNERLQAIAPTNQVPGWVRDIYGDSPEGAAFYKKFLAEEKAPLRDEIKREILQEERQRALKAKQEEERWKDWVDEQIDELADEGKTFDRNELQKVALDYMPSDEDGNIDFRKAYDIYEKLKASSINTEKSKARKELAAATTSKPEPEEKPHEYQTPQSLRNKSWRDLLK